MDQEKDRFVFPLSPGERRVIGWVMHVVVVVALTTLLALAVGS